MSLPENCARSPSPARSARDFCLTFPPSLSQASPASTPRSITGSPRPIIDKLNKALRDALASDEVKRQLGTDGTDITPGAPEDYAALIDKDEKKWAQLVKESGIQPE